MALSPDRVVGVLLGTAIGDALGMPVEGLTHQNVRTYYKGIKEYRDDDQRGDLEAGQWTDDTQLTFAVVRVLTTYPDCPGLWPEVIADAYVDLLSSSRRWGPTTTKSVERLAEGVSPSESGSAAHPSDGAAMRSAPLAIWWAARNPNSKTAFDTVRSVLSVTHRHPAALVAGWGQVVAVRLLLEESPGSFERSTFWNSLVEATTWAEGRLRATDRVSSRLRLLADQIDSFPLDLRDMCGRVGRRADEAWPFACAMVARRPHLLENTLLSGINVGGDADTTGAMMGAMLGALHGGDAFPDEWWEGLEDVDRLTHEARVFSANLLPGLSTFSV